MALGGDGDPPLDGRAADRQVAQTAFDESQHLVAPGLRPDEIGVLLVVFQQAVAERRELEKVVLLGDSFGGAAAIGARIAGPGVAHVQLIEDAVLPGVGAFLNVAVLLAPQE
jgi:hypothetical protein